ncbi:nitroreductase family deazaflavin-dependent oxidoreductase [Gordonia sp. HY285]|uniref:nitroreductase family deazaflavin-dependent oxidoreductase n=1 Tax=Gordonia liuliyuniae TaxID=2911517 RepID=UPI001F003A2C|nr:nitroreductase family deazaflavin-dependent oxidoreductase [Gordonia liuliyuniae]MCF8611402.1 nitroreductase family deazaflavin-dependent oxidoreductase [Gordonia liuliyuniae]
MSVGARLLRTRWLVRSPIPLFRAGLGFLFGTRVLLLEHIGRVSGESRFVVLECVERPDDDHVILASGFGEKSQWYRNLVAEPRCAISIGFARRRPGTASVLSADEGRAVIERYRQRSPKAYDELSGVIEEATGLAIDAIPYVEVALDAR